METLTHLSFSFNSLDNRLLQMIFADSIKFSTGPHSFVPAHPLICDFIPP